MLSPLRVFGPGASFRACPRKHTAKWSETPPKWGKAGTGGLVSETSSLVLDEGWFCAYYPHYPWSHVSRGSVICGVLAR